MESSLWEEPDYVVKIFMTMLAKKDSDHIYRGTAFALGKQANKPEAEVLKALQVLSSPDKRRMEHQEYDGRRIKAVEDGWLILNGERYREMVSEEMRKARNRRSQAAWRARQKELRNGRDQVGYATWAKSGQEAHDMPQPGGSEK